MVPRMLSLSFLLLLLNQIDVILMFKLYAYLPEFLNQIKGKIKLQDIRISSPSASLSINTTSPPIQDF